MACSLGPTPPRLGAGLQQVADDPAPILKPATGGGSLDAGCQWHPTLGRTSGKQSLLNDVLMRLAVCVLTALQSSISVAVALPALHCDDSTCWAVIAVSVLACTIHLSWITFDAG